MSSKFTTIGKGLEALALINPEELAPDPAEEAPARVETTIGADATEAHASEADVTETPPDLESLLSELASAQTTLERVARQDEEARALAERELAAYDALAAEHDEAERALARAAEVRRRADELATGAFAEEARRAAALTAERAAVAERQAASWAGTRHAAVERYAAEHDIEGVLADRRRRQEAEEARAAQATKAERLAGALAVARRLAAASRFEEARELLGPVANENPGNLDASSLLESIARAIGLRKAREAEDALWQARREHRRNPSAAAERLAALDVADLPDDLRRQIFGCWAQACARLCRHEGLVEPLRYAPDPGRGAVLARRSADGAYVVISALGVPDCSVGEPAPTLLLRGARPLR